MVSDFPKPVSFPDPAHFDNIVGLTRREMILDEAKLLRMYEQTVKDEPM